MHFKLPRSKTYEYSILIDFPPFSLFSLQGTVTKYLLGMR